MCCNANSAGFQGLKPWIFKPLNAGAEQAAKKVQDLWVVASATT
jgi:hypothetical protein